MPAVTALHRLFLALAVLVAVATLAGCKSRGDEFEMKGSPEKIHELATRDIERGNFSGAIQKLELLEARFPFSDPAKQGQLDLILRCRDRSEARRCGVRKRKFEAHIAVPPTAHAA